MEGGLGIPQECLPFPYRTGKEEDRGGGEGGSENLQMKPGAGRLERLRLRMVVVPGPVLALRDENRVVHHDLGTSSSSPKSPGKLSFTPMKSPAAKDKGETNLSDGVEVGCFLQKQKGHSHYDYMTLDIYGGDLNELNKGPGV